MCPLRPLLATLLLSLALPARAEKPFRLWASVGADYNQTLLKAAPDDPGYETSWTGVNAAVRFSSALWSRKVLGYALWVNAEQGRQTFGDADNDSDRLGYGVELNLFPKSANQLQLRWGKGTYDYTSGTVSSYTEKEDFLGARGVLGGWVFRYDRRQFLREGLNLDDRTFDIGSLDKHWNFGPSQMKLELRHQADDYTFFRYANRTDTAGAYWSGPVGGDGSLNANLILQRFTFKDEDLGYEDSGDLGRLTSTWNQPWNWRWETLASLDAGSSDASSGLDASLRGRYRLTTALRWDLWAGFLSASRDGARASYPYYGTGLYLFDARGPWRLTGEGGILRYGKDALAGDREQASYYATAGVSWGAPATRLALEVNYRHLAVKFVETRPGEPPPEATVQLARNSFFVKFEGTQRLWASGSLRLTSLSDIYTVEEGAAVDDIASWSNQLDLLLPRGTVGGRVLDYRQEGAGNPYEFTSWDVHANYALNTHLTLEAFYLQRDRTYEGREERETETQVSFLYVVGKFHFSLQFHELESESDASYRDDRVIRLVLRRWFGDA